MAQQGGYRKPANPAPVSGPGRMSKRTDGGVQPIRDVPGGDYGDRQTMRQLQQSAPLAATPSPSAPSGGGAPVNPAANVVPFGAPTARPDEPVTTGSPMGAGPGPAILGLPQPPNANRRLSDVLAQLAQNDPTGDVQTLYQMAVNRGW